MSSNAAFAARHLSIATILRLGRVFCLLVLMAAGLVYFPDVNAELHRDSMSNLDVVSGWSAYPVTFDGMITDEQEWSDAYQQSTVLFRGWFDNESPPLRSNDTVTTTFWLKNDAKWLYLLAHVNSTSRDPVGVAIAYYWWSWHGVWDGGRRAWVERDSKVYDAYYVNQTYFPWVEPTNVKGASSCITFLVSGSDCWFEFAKMLRSDDAHDWSMAPGDVVGTRPPDLQFVVYFSRPNGDRDYYIRYVTLHLSPETESETPSLVIASFNWRPTEKETFGYGSFAMSPDFVAKTNSGTSEIRKILIEATVHKFLVPEMEYAFDLGVTVGDAPEVFSLKCSTDSCSSASTNPYYGLALMFDARARGDQRIELEIDFSQLEFTVASSNSTRSPTLILHSDRLSFDSIIPTTGSTSINLIFWSGHRERAGKNLQVVNATMHVEFATQPRLLGMLPKPRFEKLWTSDISREGLQTIIASVAIADDGHTMMVANDWNYTVGRYEAAEVYFLDSNGHVLWSKRYDGGTFYWNLLNLGLTPDGRLAAYAIFSSNKGDAGIWYVDSNGNPVWTHHEQWYHSVAMSADGALVAAVKAVNKATGKLQADGNLLVLDGQGRVLWEHRFPEELPMKVVVSPDGQLIAVTTGVGVGLREGSNSSVYLFDASGRILWRHVGSGIARAVDLSTQAAEAVVSYRDGTIELLDIRSGAVLGRYFHSYVLHSETRGYYQGGDTFSVAITQDGSQIVTSQGFSLFVFTKDLSSLLSVPWIPDSVSNVAESRAGNFVAAGTFSGKLYFYGFILEKTDEYLRNLDRLLHGLELQNATLTFDDVIQLESQGKWLDAYRLSLQMVNATIAVMRNLYSESHAQAQIDVSAARRMFNETSRRFNDSKSRLDSTKASRALTILSEASGLLDEAESYLAKAPEEFRSGNYAIALKFVQRATQSIKEARSQMSDLDAVVNGPPSMSGMNGYLVPMTVAVLVVLALPAIWLIQKGRRKQKH